MTKIVALVLLVTILQMYCRAEEGETEEKMAKQKKIWKAELDVIYTVFL